MATTSKDTRAFKASKKAKAGVLVQTDAASLIADDSHFIVVDEKGISLRGPISIIATADGVRRAGLWIGLTDFQKELPSCIPLPLPETVRYPPVHVLATITEDIAHFMAFLV